MTSCKQILVHLDGGKRCAQRLEIASRLGGLHGAAVAALYAGAPSLRFTPPYPQIDPVLSASLKAMDDQRRDAARALVDQWTEPGARISWGELFEYPFTASFAQQALHADLLVLGQHDPDGGSMSGVPTDFVPSVLARSGKPAIVVPCTGRLPDGFDTVAIAWKPTREAARAVEAALPLLQACGHVHVLAWREKAPPSGEGALLDLDRYLRLHGVQAHWHHANDDGAAIGGLLLSAAGDRSADLLVMGCYGHSRAREWLLGGVTRTVLGRMTLPVLMAQ